MKLERLEIRSLPGLDEPVTIRFEPDAINFITGPNASGKSSIVRAVRALLYPETSPGFRHIRGLWRLDGQRLEGERHGEQVSWREDGEAAPPPRLPGSESVGAYLISAEDLSRFGETEAHISSQIRMLLAGGYDLDAVVDSPPLAPPARPQKRARELADAQRAIEEKQAEYEAFRDELDTLEQLQQELDATGDAAGRLRACEDALALADAIAARTALENTLIDEFPGGMDRLRGDELARLDQIDEQIAGRNKDLALAREALESAEEKLAATGSIEPQQLEAVQSQLADRRDELAELERRIDQHAGALEQAVHEREAAARRLGSQRPSDQPELAVEDLQQIERQVDRVLDEREKVRALTTELARLHVPRAEAAVPVAQIKQAREALAEWLEYCRLSPLEGVLWSGLTLAGVLAGWRLLGPRDLDPFGELILLVLIAIGVPATLLGRYVMRYRDFGQARTRFLATEIEPPLGWSEEEVETRLERLDRELESATHRQAQHDRANELRERLNEERGRLEHARGRLQKQAEDLGLDAEVRVETGFMLWARHLHDWQRASAQLERHRQALEQSRSAHAAARKQALELLSRHGFEQREAVSSRDLSDVLHRLAPRMRTNAELYSEVQAQRHRIDELEADLAMLRERHDSVFEQAGLHAGDRDTLVKRIEQFEEWRQLEQQRRDRSMEVARLEKILGSEKALLAEAREQKREALSARREELAELAARRDELNRRIATIHTRHDELGRRRELQALTGAYERQRQMLEDDFDAHVLSAIGRALIEDVRVAHQTDNEPAALRQAARWFDRFTRHRYRLRFRGQRFEAFDNRSERTLGLTELSTATRAQLLLALRLAWIESAERNREPLPVFMDEVLTTSDPDRYRQVVESVQDIAAGGRQMFYLTAQKDEATAWATWVDDGPKPHTVDMAEVRREQVEPLTLAMPKGETRERSVPEPGDETAEEWARKAGIGGIDPWLGTGRISVFHLLHDDLTLAARLMRLELGRIGELRAFLEQGDPDGLLAAEERDRLERRCRAATAIIDDWRSRHHRPVDAAALSAFGQITDTFMPRVLELAAATSGHPIELIEGLKQGRVSRFRSDTTEALEQWLAENGYIARRPDDHAITAAELASRVSLEPEEAANLREWIVSAIADPLTDNGRSSGPGNRASS